MKRNTVFMKGICIFSAVTLLAGMFSGCSRISKMMDRYLPDDPLNKLPGLQEEQLDDHWKDPLATTESIPDDPEPTITEAPTTEPTVTEAPTTQPPVTEAPATEPVTTAPRVEPSQWPGETTASVLNVREYPGTDYQVVRGLERGSRVVILEKTVVDGEVWGRVHDGWVSMKYVALDGVIEGSWYELIDVETDAYIYWIWDFHQDNTFVYTKCSLRPSEDFSISRQIAQGGGRYLLDGETLHMELSYGDRVDVCGSYLSVNGSTNIDTVIYGASMTWDSHYSLLNRGTLETIQKQLRKP